MGSVPILFRHRDQYWGSIPWGIFLVLREYSLSCNIYSKGLDPEPNIWVFKLNRSMTPWIEIENFQCLKSSNAQGPEPCTLTTTTCLEVSQLYCPKSPKTLHDLFGDIYLVTSSVIACGHFVVYGASGPLQNCSLVLYLCVTLTSRCLWRLPTKSCVSQGFCQWE